jgi:hypothetical protein
MDDADRRCGTCKHWQREYERHDYIYDQDLAPCAFSLATYLFALDYYELSPTAAHDGQTCKAWEGIDKEA